MTTQTMTRLRDLKLSGMATALEQQLQQIDTFEALPFIERLSLLLEQEQSLRENRKQQRLTRLLIATLMGPQSSQVMEPLSLRVNGATLFAG